MSRTKMDRTKMEKLNEEMNTRENKMEKSMLMLFALLMSFSVLVAGCTVQKVTEQARSAESSPSQETTSPERTPKPVVTEQTDIVAETKTAQEITEETFVSLVADGTYKDQVTYNYHSGSEDIEISVTVEDDVIIGASITGINPHKTSAKFIGGLNAALPELVIGKKINELDLPKQISGSSLTTAAFKGYVEGLIEKY